MAPDTPNLRRAPGNPALASITGSGHSVFETPGPRFASHHMGGYGSMPTTRRVIIIGSGPAGYTAAIYAARANLAPLMLTGLQAGGQLPLTTLVENYPGFVDGLMGRDLMQAMGKQAERFGTEMIAADVTAVDFSRRPFVVRTADDTFEGLTVIIATGASSKMLGLPAEKTLMGRGISTCATCDGFFF